MKRSIYLLLPLFLAGCNSDNESENHTPVEVVIDAEFSEGTSAWRHGFSDYPVADEEIYQLEGGVKAIPNSDSQGYMLAGMNRSDDLFMYIKRPVLGLVANTRYQVTAKIDLWSEVGDQCFGIGGSPGSAVYVKFGAVDKEPKQDDYYMNIDLGHQSNGGADAKVMDNIIVHGLDCHGGTFGEKVVELTQESKFEVTSSENGEIWLFLGTDSGFEGYTQVYYESINVTLSPL